MDGSGTALGTAAMRQDHPPGRVLVLGIGNILWADEGFGVRCVEALDAGHDLGPDACIMDGGTQGLNLVPAVAEADDLLVFDAVDFGEAPGTLILVRDDEVPRFLAAKKMSLHQTGFQEVLSCADLLGHLPRRITLIGVQPLELEDYGGSLTGAVRATLDRALALGLEELRGWGLTPVPRAVPAGAVDGVVLPEVTLERYERDRPSAEAACRIGDARILILGGLMPAPVDGRGA